MRDYHIHHVFLCILMSLQLQIFAIAVHKGRKAAPVCEDRYPEYCRRLSAENCYVRMHRSTCCVTCAHLLAKYMHLPPACRYGDRSKTCYMAYSKPHVCYRDKRRHPRRQRCCETCDSIRRDIGGVKECAFGDRDPSLCMYIRLRHCSSAYVHKMCCVKCTTLTSNQIPRVV